MKFSIRVIRSLVKRSSQIPYIYRTTVAIRRIKYLSLQSQMCRCIIEAGNPIASQSWLSRFSFKIHSPNFHILHTRILFELRTQSVSASIRVFRRDQPRFTVANFIEQHLRVRDHGVSRGLSRERSQQPATRLLDEDLPFGGTWWHAPRRRYMTWTITVASCAARSSRNSKIRARKSVRPRATFIGTPKRASSSSSSSSSGRRTRRTEEARLRVTRRGRRRTRAPILARADHLLLHRTPTRHGQARSGCPVVRQIRWRPDVLAVQCEPVLKDDPRHDREVCSRRGAVGIRFTKTVIRTRGDSGQFARRYVPREAVGALRRG